MKGIQDLEGRQAYWVHSKIINTADHGVPHHRKRWYCVGILKSKYENGKEFRFLSDVECSLLSRFLDPSSPLGGAEEKSAHVKNNLEIAFKQIK